MSGSASLGLSRFGSAGAKLRRILGALSPLERDALFRFYSLAQSNLQVSRALGLSEGELRELKSRVKRAYLATAGSQ